MRQCALRSRALATAAGLAADRLVGEPTRWHPVAAFGQLMTEAERRTYRDHRAAGLVHAAAGTTLGVAVGWLAERAGGGVGVAAAVAVASAGSMLGASARAVGAAVRIGDLEQARVLLPALVGRDPSGLDEAGVCRAVVESVAENSVDAVVAPAFWALLGGGAGVCGHRAVNTLDAMVGHRSTRYRNFGWASARLDDVAAWAPARLAALAVAAVRPARAAAVWRAVRAQAPAHPSPNGGVVEAAYAAALDVSLGGPSRYGDRVEERPRPGAGPPPGPADVARAVALLDDVTAAVGVACAVLAVLAGLLSRRRPRDGRPRRRTVGRPPASRLRRSWRGRAGTR